MFSRLFIKQLIEIYNLKNSQKISKFYILKKTLKIIINI